MPLHVENDESPCLIFTQIDIEELHSDFQLIKKLWVVDSDILYQTAVALHQSLILVFSAFLTSSELWGHIQDVLNIHRNIRAYDLPPNFPIGLHFSISIFPSWSLLYFYKWFNQVCQDQCKRLMKPYTWKVYQSAMVPFPTKIVLIMSAWWCVEVEGCWQQLPKPPVMWGLNPTRRLFKLLRSCSVLFCSCTCWRIISWWMNWLFLFLSP